MTTRRAFTAKRVRGILLDQGHVPCGLCGKRLMHFQDIEFHHFDPIAAGGSDDDATISAVHKECHQRETKTNTWRQVKRARRAKNGKPRRGREIQSRPLSDPLLRKPMDGTVEARKPA